MRSENVILWKLNYSIENVVRIMYIMLVPNCNIPTEQYLYGIVFTQKLIIMENISLEMGII